MILAFLIFFCHFWCDNKIESTKRLNNKKVITKLIPFSWNAIKETELWHFFISLQNWLFLLHILTIEGGLKIITGNPKSAFCWEILIFNSKFISSNESYLIFFILLGFRDLLVSSVYTDYFLRQNFTHIAIFYRAFEESRFQSGWHFML